MRQWVAGRWRVWFVFGAIACSGAIVIITVRWLRSDSPSNNSVTASSASYQPPSDEGYVGSQACQECHSELHEQYAAHPMFNSVQLLDDAKAIETFDASKARFDAMGRSYQVIRDDTGIVHEELMEDDGGALVFHRKEAIHYGVGAGTKGRSYMLFRDGWCYQSPITWYSETSDWNLSPGYERPRHKGFQRMINGMCFFCHSGRVNFESRHNFKLKDPPFAEVAIGCERCHGPGNAHVDMMQGVTVAPQKGEDLLIVNPAGLAPEIRDSICNQCHLEGAARVLRRDRKFYDFRPGQNVEQVWTVFVDPHEEATFTGQPEQMVHSTCYKKSAGKLGCVSCHDPHALPDPMQREVFYRNRCLNCHTERGCNESSELRMQKKNSCIACHMPRGSSVDIAHATVTDHRVLRRPSSQKSQRQLANAESAVWQRFSDEPLSEPEFKRAQGLALYLQSNQTKNLDTLVLARQLLEQVASSQPGDLSVHRVLARIYYFQREYQKSREHAEVVIEQQPRHQEILGLLGLVCYKLDDDQASRKYYRRLMDVNPWDERAFGPYAELLGMAGRLDEALELAERGIALNPTDKMLRSVLSDLYQRKGKFTEARQQLELRQRIESQLGQ